MSISSRIFSRLLSPWTIAVLTVDKERKRCTTFEYLNHFSASFLNFLLVPQGKNKHTNSNKFCVPLHHYWGKVVHAHKRKYAEVNWHIHYNSVTTQVMETKKPVELPLKTACKLKIKAFRRQEDKTKVLFLHQTASTLHWTEQPWNHYVVLWYTTALTHIRAEFVSLRQATPSGHYHLHGATWL